MKMLESETPVVSELEEPVDNPAVSHLEEVSTIMQTQTKIFEEIITYEQYLAE